jgi:tetratricopeptide (TPR) repeat protein/DNA polymerase III delta prime subunit
MTSDLHSHDPDKRTGGVVIGDVEGSIRESTIAGRDVNIGHRITQFFGFGLAEQRAQRNRRAMLELVRNTWIKGVLEQSLHGAAMIELGMEERAEAVKRPWDMVLQMPDRPDRTLLPGTKIVDVFDETSCALLILGKPGSGKTTTLLELARDTIARAEEDPTQPIPVVFNLSSWAEKRQTIAEWLVEELNTKYQIPKRIARPWVENDDLLLLLDGLDEVAAEHRGVCVEATNDFRQEHGLAPVVVCSRIADYEALANRLELQGAVVLQSLTPEQIDRYLAGTGTELLAVRGTLEHDPTLQELAQTPLMLGVMTLAYRGMSVHDLGSLDTTEARRTHVFDAYVQRMFERRGSAQYYSPEQTVEWLIWLAQKMLQYNQSVFLIERIQPSWLQTRAQRCLHTIIVRSTVSLAGGLILGASFGLIGWLFGGLTIGLVAGLISGLTFGLIVELGHDINPVEALEWSWRRAHRGLIDGVKEGLKEGLVVWSHGGNTRGALLKLLTTRSGWTGGLIVELFSGLGGLVDGLIRGLRDGLIRVEVGMNVTPNQGIRRSARSAVISGLWIGLIVSLVPGLISGLISGLIGGLIRGLTRGLIVGLSFGLSFGLIFGLNYGGAAVIQHLILRFILCRNGHIPKNYTHFLDYASDRVFLRKVGGGYAFVHRLLLDHFAMLGENAMVHYYQGIACCEAGDLKQAIFEFSRSIELCSDYGPVYLCRANVFRTQGDYERAIEDYTKVIELTPSDPAAYFYRADAFRTQGDYERAIEDYTKVIELTPSDPAAYFYRADAYRAAGNVKRSVPDYARAAELSPDNVDYCKSLCLFGSLAGHATDVMYECELAVRLAPDHGAIRDIRGLARALTGNYDGAIDDFRFYVEWSKEHDEYEPYGRWREAWIAELEAGRNPFDEATLEELLNEYLQV